MPKSFIDVQDEYSQFKTQHPDDQTPMSEFAKQMDEVQGTPGERGEAYNDAWYKRANAVVDRGFRATHVPQVVGAGLGGLAGLVDSAVGTHMSPTVEKLGEELPRTLVESLATIPEAASGVGAPAAAATWVNRANTIRRILGYGGAALSGYASTESPIGAAIGAGSMYGANKLLLPEARGGLDVGGRAAQAVRERLGIAPAVESAVGSDLTSAAPEVAYGGLAGRVLPTTAAAGAEAGTLGALNEATRQANLSVGPHAVGPTDSARNPFTEENVASQAVGALPFAGQAALGLSHASGFDPKALRGMHDWIQQRKAAVEADTQGVVDGAPAQVVQDATGKAPAPTVQPEFDLEAALREPVQKFTPDEQKTLVAAVRSHLDTAKMAKGEGADADAQASYGKAKSLLDQLSMKEDDIPAAQRATQEIDTQARQMPPQDTKGLGEFVQKVNGLIEFWNENRAKVETGENPPGPVVGPEQAYHPSARDPSVVQRLQQKELLPRITYDWLKKEYDASFDDLGNPQFASDVVAQKVANRLLDNLPDALKQESSTQVDTPVSPRVQKVDAQEAKFFDALSQFPSEVQDRLVDQTIKFRRAPDTYFQGRQLNRYDSWQRAVITAAQTYDPIERTVSVYKGGKLQKTSIATLLAADYEPVATPVKVGAGGKGKVSLGGKTIPEGNIEAMTQPENVIPEGEQSLVEQAGQAGLSGDTSQGAIFRKQEGDAAAPVEETLPAEVPQATRDKFLPQAEQYRKTVESLSPQQAWNLVRGLFDKSKGLNDFREPNAKLALQAVAEQLGGERGDTVGPAGKQLVEAYKAAGYGVSDKWSDRRTLGVILHSFFPSHVPADATTQMTTLSSGRQAVKDRQANMYAWVRKATERVLDPKAVEAAKQYGGPMAMVGEGTTSGTNDLLVNKPKPGDFQPDVLRTLRVAFTKALGEKGYSGSFRDLAVEMGVAIARQADPSLTDFYRIATGPRGLAWDAGGRGSVGLNVDTPAEAPGNVKWVHAVMNTLTHEIAHVDDYIALGMLPKPDAFSDERARQLQNMRALAESMAPDQRAAILSTLEAGLRPSQFATIGKEKETGLPYGSSKPAEFTAVVRSLVEQSLLFGKPGALKNAMDVLDYSPIEVQEFARGTYRTILDVADALKEMIANPDVRQAAPISEELNRYVTSEAFDALVEGARYASKVRDGTKEVAAARDYIASVASPAGLTMPQGATDAMWYKRVEDTSKYVPGLETNPRQMAGVVEAIDTARNALGLPSKLTDKDVKPGLFFDNLVPFGQVMWKMQRDGVKVAAPVADLLLSMEESIHSRRSAILAPLMKRDKSGAVDWNQDNPFVGGVTPQVRAAFNEVSRWQRENARSVDAKGTTIAAMEPMFVLDKNGVIQPNAQHPANAIAAWAEMSKNMSPETMNAVMAGSVAADQIGQSMNAYSTSVIRESATTRVARMLMTFNPQLGAQDAHAWAEKVMVGFESGDLTQAGLQQDDAAAIGSFLNGEGGPLDTLRKLQAFQEASPGYRTEQLPGDWIVQYKDSDGKLKYASAPSEKQAQYVMKKAEAQGNTLVGDNPKNRNDLRGKFQDFDDPAEVVERAAFLENQAWRKAVDTVRASKGDAAADAMMLAYKPMTDSLRDVTSQGFRKFIEPSASKVDRENYDYLDGMLSRAGRLASSGAYHTHGAMKDLILNDPSVRQYPSFATKVNEQWDHLVSPNDMTTSRVKAISAAYYLGANLSSILIRGTHSLSTFAPVLMSLDSTGGPVKAWGNIFQAIGHAVTLSPETVETTANAALRRNPATWTADDQRAVALQRATNGGVIGNNVFSEIFSSKDFRTQQNAAFGMGDYGKPSVGERFMNGLYVASQLSTALYGWVAKNNDKVGFIAGVNQGLEKGLTGDALYSYARQYWQLATGGGGKENMPGFVAKSASGPQIERSAVGLAYTLQHYGTTLVGLYAQLGKDAIWGSKALSPQEKRQAQKAFGTMLMTQTAAAGALGLPFVGAALVTLEKAFGVQATQAVRTGLASLGASEDDPDAPSWTKGSVIAETGMNGLFNQMFGLDLSARIGASSVFGISSYRGFDGGDLLGPTSSIVSNMADALNLYGQGKPWKAATALVPQAFKDAMGLAESHAKYGDYSIRDGGDNLVYTPSPQQAVGYSMGFRPRQVSERRQEANLLQTSNDRFGKLQEVRLNNLAENLLSGNPAPARQYAQELRSVDPTVQIDDSLRAVMERAVSLVQERDALAGGPRLNRQSQTQIASTFPQDQMQRQSEVGLNSLRTQLAARLGAPELMPQGEDWTRAAVVDSMVQKSGGKMPRSQAAAMVRLMGL